MVLSSEIILDVPRKEAALACARVAHHYYLKEGLACRHAPSITHLLIIFNIHTLPTLFGIDKNSKNKWLHQQTASTACFFNEINCRFSKSNL
jgi:hypothetical protein